MPLNRVRIQAFRCLSEVELTLHPWRTYVFGPNGAGKTSLLEGIYVLGRGRSFRTRDSRRLIQRGRSGFSVYGELAVGADVHRLGVGRGTGSGLELRLDGERPAGLTALAKLLPVHVIGPNIHSLIEGGPADRRRFLDWGVFHVEQGYLEAWRRYRRILGQRNAALKSGVGAGGWDQGLLEAGLVVHQARAEYTNRLGGALAGLGETLLGAPLEVGYRPGWSPELAFGEALDASRARDRATGITQVGPHRAELRVNLAARGVREEVSRGQQKLVAAGLILAQIRIFAASRGGDGGVLLVDDPAAELDAGALAGLLAVLDRLPAQQILTGLSATFLVPATGCPVFHVEQGGVSAVL